MSIVPRRAVARCASVSYQTHRQRFLGWLRVGVLTAILQALAADLRKRVALDVGACLVVLLSGYEEILIVVFRQHHTGGTLDILIFADKSSSVRTSEKLALQWF